MPKVVLIARLTNKLQDNLALGEDIARWTVESWALALGLISENECGVTKTHTPVVMNQGIQLIAEKTNHKNTNKQQSSVNSSQPTESNGWQKTIIFSIVSLIGGELVARLPGSITAGFPSLKTHVFEVATLTVVDEAEDDPD